MVKAEKKPRVNKHGLPRAIPAEIKRLVRKRCGFGCVICGLGIYEYEHFNLEFNKAKIHEADGITLLCPNHHTKKTTGKLSVETVRIFNAEPKALRQGFASEHLDLRTQNPVVILGTARFVSTPVLIQLEEEPILMIKPGEDEEEPFLLSATIRDKNGEIILQIVDNQWQTPANYWDVTSEGKYLRIRSASKQVELVLRQEPPDTIVIERLKMAHKGFKIEVSEGVPMSITNAYGGDMNISGTTSVSYLFLKDAVGFGLPSHYTPKQGLELMKDIAESDRLHLFNFPR